MGGGRWRRCWWRSVAAVDGEGRVAESGRARSCNGVAVACPEAAEDELAAADRATQKRDVDRAIAQSILIRNFRERAWHHLSE